VFIEDFHNTSRTASNQSDILPRRENVIIPPRNRSDDIQLVTLRHHQQPNCNQITSKLVNRFRVNSRTWTNDTFFIDKSSNFNGCQFVVKVFHPSLPAVNVTFDANGTLPTVTGYGPKLIEEISRSLNFSFIYNPHTMVKDSEGNYIGNIYRNLNCDFDIIPSSMRRISAVKARNFITTHFFTTVDEIILISRYAPYSMFEKIFMPFEGEVWIWLGLSLLISVLVILVLAKSPKFIRDFVVGWKVQGPLMNLM
jgi:hypothetical protein